MRRNAAVIKKKVFHFMAFNFHPSVPSTIAHQNQSYQAVRHRDSSSRGAPRLQVTKEQLRFFCHLQFSVPHMAKMLNVSVRTIHRRMRYFLSFGCIYTVEVLAFV